MCHNVYSIKYKNLDLERQNIFLQPVEHMTDVLWPENIYINTQFSVVSFIPCRNLYAKGHWNHIHMTVTKLKKRKKTN